MIGRDCFRQSKIKQGGVGKTETGSKEERNLNPPATKNTADRWSKNEAKAKRRTDHAHSLSAVLFSSDIGNIGLRRGNVAAGDAVKNPSQKKHPERSCKTENQKADARADNGNKQHRPAAMLVRQSPQNRRE